MYIIIGLLFGFAVGVGKIQVNTLEFWVLLGLTLFLLALRTVKEDKG